MPYDLYPAVDENYNFPPEVRAALAKSPELRNTVVQMTTAERNNLTAAEKWDGRLILNTDTDRVQRYDSVGLTWFTVAEQADAVVAMSEASRDNLSGSELFNGRLVLNTTTNRINRYDSETTTWVPIIEEADLSQILATTGTPQPIGTAARGVSSKAAREDHVHALPGGSIASISEGSYVGDQVYPRTISLPFTPKLVYIYATNEAEHNEGFVKDSTFLWRTKDGATYLPGVTIVSNGFSISSNGGTEAINRSVNTNAQTYKYVALA